MTVENFSYDAETRKVTMVYTPTQEGTYTFDFVIYHPATRDPGRSYTFRIKINIRPAKTHSEEIKEVAQAVSNEPTHSHYFTWVQRTPATATQDGTMAYQCECGAVESIVTVPNSAASVRITDWANQIAKAKAGATVTLNTEDWIVLNKMMKDTIANRRDVTIVINYKDQGTDHQITIPAGQDISAKFDANGWCGYRNLGEYLTK